MNETRIVCLWKIKKPIVLLVGSNKNELICWWMKLLNCRVHQLLIENLIFSSCFSLAICLSFGGIRHLNFFTASSKGDHSRHDGSHQLGEEISLNLACADVWVVFSNIFKYFLVVTEFKGSIPDSSENIPEVVTNVGDCTLEGVNGSHQVEWELSCSCHSYGLDEEVDAANQFISELLPTCFGLWDGFSDTFSGDCLSTFLKETCRTSCWCWHIVI